jgi:hypothetical protein
MFTNAKPSELIDVVAAIDPDAYSAAAVSSGYADMSDYEALLAVELAGDMVSNSTLDLALHSAVAASGGALVTGKSITQLTKAGSDDNKQALINLRRSELTEGHRYVKMVRTLGTAGSDEAALLLGIKGVLVPNCLPSEVIGLVGCIDPDAYAPATVTGDWIDMAKWHAALGVLMIGDLGGDCSVSMKWEQATTSGGTAKDVTGAATATYTVDSPDTVSNQQVKLDLRAEDLDVANGYRWVRLSVTAADASSPASATSDLAAVAFGVFPRIGVASAHDLASVDEIV